MKPRLLLRNENKRKPILKASYQLNGRLGSTNYKNWSARMRSKKNDRRWPKRPLSDMRSRKWRSRIESIITAYTITSSSPG